MKRKFNFNMSHEDKQKKAKALDSVVKRKVTKKANDNAAVAPNMPELVSEIMERLDNKYVEQFDYEFVEQFISNTFAYLTEEEINKALTGVDVESDEFDNDLDLDQLTWDIESLLDDEGKKVTE